MIVRMANTISSNGYIARLSGEEDWLSSDNWMDFLREAKEFDNFVMGRETYELVMRLYKDHNFDDVDCRYKIIVTSQDLKVSDDYKVVHSPQEAIDFLKMQGLEKLLLIGGGKLNSEFARLNLIDEVSLTVAPHILGQGRPVLAEGNYEFSLKLVEVKKLTKDRIRLLYTTSKNRGEL
ncbi:MAG: dihydrofolate reductase family protein [Candidatus Saccharimonadales bacterium]